jgi:hypothetical protein
MLVPMTAPAPETIERERHKLFVTDAELMRRLGVDPKLVRPTIRMLDANPKSGFPKKQKLLGQPSLFSGRPGLV